MDTDSLAAVVHANTAAALAEDVGGGDLTASLIDAEVLASASIIAREPAVIAGQPWVDEVFRQLDADIHIDWYVADGQSVETNDIVCKLVGNARALLTGERSALNFLQTLSATATQTAAYANAIADTECRVLDTRKTLPGLRQAQKYAVRMGGGRNHRSGLYDAILIKENHIRSAGGIAAAVKRAQQQSPDVLIEVEVENNEELRAALDAGVVRVLLDNYTLSELSAAVAINRDEYAGQADLEASGNVDLSTLRDIALTGVDFISTGAITKHVRAVDLSMLFGA